MIFRYIPSDETLKKRLKYRGSKKLRRATARLEVRRRWREGMKKALMGYEVIPAAYASLVNPSAVLPKA